MAQVAEVIDRHAAAINAGLARSEGLERFGAAGEAVSEGCRSDFQPMETDVEFSTITKLDIEEEVEILIKIELKISRGGSVQSAF